MAQTGKTRQSTMAVDLGGEQVLLERLDCIEVLGRPFTITVDIISSLGEIDLLPHLGKPVAVKVSEDDVHVRAFHGLITEAEQTKDSEAGFHYRLTARPFTYFMAQNRSFAIFQDKSALDIIKQVFEDAGASDVDYTKISRSYPPRVYCVQYRESDFAFISRLMEEEGIYYYFQHSGERHTLVLCDSPSGHPQTDPGSLTYNPRVQSVFNNNSQPRYETAKSFMHRWAERVSTGAEARVTLRDFDLEKPDRPLQAIAREGGKHPNDNREVYDYPGGFVDEGRGAALGKTRLEAYRADRYRYHGESQQTALFCGGKFSLRDHPTGRLNAAYLIVRSYHSITAETYRSSGGGSENAFNISFEAIPAATPFRLPRSTPRPRVEGLETAVVSGPDGEHIYVDEYGRVKIRFNWDRSGSAGEKSTCWVRVAQFGNLGSVILPRVGQEVMVDFLSGDPDHPIVCGWVFNKTHMPVYDLPANKTRALWRTMRYGDAGDYPEVKQFDIQKPGANELRFEDKGGKEEVFLHAERDHNTRVRFDQTNQVGHDQDQKVGHNRTIYVGVDDNLKIDGTRTMEVKGKQTDKVHADREVHIDNNDSNEVGQSIKISAGTTIEMSANTSITLKVGTSSLVLDGSGVTMKGMSVTTEGQLQNTMKGVMTEVDGSGMVTVKGGVVMIN